jgi:hypothetical protein
MSPRFLLPLIFLLPAPASAPDGRGVAPSSFDEVRRRITPQALAALVAGPIALADSGDLAAAEAEFEQLRHQATFRHGKGSVETHDLLTAFALGLYGSRVVTIATALSADEAPQVASPDPRKALALSVFRRAAIEARGAFGPDHIETSLALYTLAEALLPSGNLAEREEVSPEEAVKALEEAYAIAAARFGTRHRDTNILLALLAEAKSHPSRIAGARGRLQEVSGLYRLVIANLPAEAGEPDPLEVRTAWIGFLVRHDQIAEAEEVVADARRRDHGFRFADGGTLLCGGEYNLAVAAAHQLDLAGHREAGARMRARYGDRGCG